MSNTKNKTYTINDLKKICNIVNDENIELLLLDFTSWLCWYNNTMNKLRKELPNETKGRENSEIGECEFIWTDDNKQGLTGVIVTNKKTGETTKRDFKTPI
jgi:hypothetical protein